MAFNLISKSIKNKTAINEYDVQKFILDEFEKRNLETEDVPVVAANENSGNPHYEPSKDEYKLINEGDIILIDLWAKYKGDINVYSDITWMGYVGENIPEKYTKIFDIVKGARDSVVNELEKLWQSGEKIYGWHLDQVARDYISKFGYGEHFIHRTGHSMAPGSELHAIGVNLDNFETRDDRLIRPGVGFSIEPGIYLDDFGVRSEINIYCDEEKGISITTNIQDSILKL
jgi:Xaa-Pro aminopeptidase